MKNHILHIDMDAFYTSVEQRNFPEYRGKPIIVGGDGRRGVVASASYEARVMGVKSAMPSVTAKKLCPKAIFVAPHMQEYKNESIKIMEIMQHYTPIIEPIALDEAYLDVKGSEALFGDAVTIGKRIQQDILDKLQLHASVGVAPNKFLAKIGSDYNKPKGFCVIDWDKRFEFLDPLSIRAIGGIGKKTADIIQNLNIHTIKELRTTSLSTLKSVLGNMADHFFNLANGIDDRSVTLPQKALSIGKETTFAEDIYNEKELHGKLLKLTDQVASRLRKKNVMARTITVKVKYADFTLVTRSSTSEKATDITKEIYDIALDLLHKLKDIRKKGTRLLGVSTSHFEEAGTGQLYLFDDDEDNTKFQEVDKVMDTIRAKYGSSSIFSGGIMENKKKSKE